MPKLTSLNLSKNKIDHSGIQALVDNFPNKDFSNIIKLKLQEIPKY